MSKAEQKVLAYVNRQRAKLKLKPLKRLPKGFPGICRACPIANALSVGGYAADVDAGHLEVWPEEKPDVTSLSTDLPKYVSRFVEDFDEGKYPHLEVAR